MRPYYERTAGKRKVTMASYPRSGSNWISYCLEQLTGLRVIGCDTTQVTIANLESRIKDPLTVIHKTHGNGRDFWGTFPTDGEGYHLVIRNYKESILRDLHSKSPEEIVNYFKGIPSLSESDDVLNTPDYLAMLQVYHNYSGPKLITYYEDMILEPGKELMNIIEWYGQFGGRFDVSEIDSFMGDFDTHKSNSMNKYKGIHGKTATDGDPKKLDIQRKTWLTNEDQINIDKTTRDVDPIVFDEYLTRYKL